MINLKKLTVGNIIIIVICAFILLYAFANSIFADYLLEKYPNCIKAQINSETYGGHTHVRYGYVFIVRGKQYSGFVLKSNDLKIGDSICVVFMESYPKINKPLSYFKREKIKCNCGNVPNRELSK